MIYAKESLGTTSAGFGLLLSAWGAGIVLGSLLYIGLKNRSGFGLIIVSSALVGLAYLGMSQAGVLWVACAMSVVGGAGNGIQWVAVMTALQEVTPPEFQARMSGLLESIGAAMPGIGLPARRPADRARLPAHRLRFRGRGNPAAGRSRPWCYGPAHERRRAQTSTTTGKHHRAALEPVVDERREVVVQVRTAALRPR